MSDFFEEDTLHGSIENIVFTSEDTGFTVAKLKLPKSDEIISLTGVMPTLQAGEAVFCKGLWKYHPKHGRQFEVKSFEQKSPVDIKGIEKYLESGLIKGIGNAYAKRIVRKFGMDTLKVIDESPEKLLSVEGIGEKKLTSIIKYWDDQKSMRDVMIFLQTHDIRASLAQKIYKVYGSDSIEKVKENPYALAKSVFGIGFKTADNIASNLKIEKTSPVRIEAAIEFTLWKLSQEGHVCYPEDELIQQVANLLDIEDNLIPERLSSLELDQKIVKKQLEDKTFIWIKPLYLSELGIAREIGRIQSGMTPIRDIAIDKATDWVEDKMHIKLASQQKEALAMAFTTKLLIITGGPGTGKSTITNGILKVSQKLTSKILLAAPTGRAAKRLSEITWKKAFTIHSLLEYDFSIRGFKKNRDTPLKCDLLIIDEASMIDTQLMYSLLKAIPDHARVIFIGDVDQLPSVGPGNVLKDFITSECMPTCFLSQIYRQAKGSKIITNSHMINKGYFPDTSNPKGSDFIFIHSEDPEDISSKIVHLVTSELPERYNLKPLQDIQVLAPMKKGGVGTEHLNHLLQKKITASNNPLVKMGREFHQGDKVMQIKNNYDKNVYNGDVGIIEAIDFIDQEIRVLFDHEAVIYEFSELDELILAYAVSIHKYQGSECPCVIMPIHTSHFKLLFRNLLYTGITRGKKLVILVGTKKALAIAVKNNKILTRFSGLKLFLENGISNA